MWTRITVIAFSVVSYFLRAENSSGKDLLFQKASANYNWDGPVGQAYRRDFDPRMFPHSTWRQRLYCETANAEADETLEIYLKSDGAHCLNFRRARPALSPLIRHRPYRDQRGELVKKLDRIGISSCEVVLEPALATEIERLWRTMLPGVEVAPVPEVFSVHGPAFIAFVREGRLVKTGAICLAAYGTETYRHFVEVVEDLKRLCTGTESSRQTIMARLPAKVRSLSARLSKQR
jgi:hypothetical protein